MTKINMKKNFFATQKKNIMQILNRRTFPLIQQIFKVLPTYCMLKVC